MMILKTLIFISLPLYIASQGYEAYGGGSSNVDNINNEANLAPQVPMAPPRVPIPQESSSSSASSPSSSSSSSGASLGYRPPPPPLRRDDKSIGQCSFDSSKWEVEPQSAIAHAIMFDRTTGLSCEECLDKCTQFQDASSAWVCRTLTYDHRFKICDLFAINGTERPYFLTQYHGRDYFVYLAALPPTDAELTGEVATSKVSSSEASVTSSASAATASKSQGSAEAAQAPVSLTATKIDSKSESPVAPPAAGAAPPAAEISPPATHVASPAPLPAAPAPSESASHESSSSVQQVASPASQAASSGSASAASGSSSGAVSGSETASVEFSSSSSSHKSSSSSSSSYSSSTNTVTSQGEKQSTEYLAVHRNSVSKSGISTCGDDEVTRYVQFESSERSNPGEEVGFAPAKTREECATACDRELIFACQSAVYSPSGCELSQTSADHGKSESLRTSSTAVYLEKTCIPKKLAKGTRTIFPAVKNFVMVGHVQEVTDAKTLAECQIACLRASEDYGFICKSAMWYPTDESQNCLLNTESHTTRPEVFTNEDQGGNMVYFEIVYEDSDLKFNSLTRRFKDSPLESSNKAKWTNWSKCKDMNGMRHRYLRCSDKKDIRKCPKESVMCRHLPALQIQKITSECRAVLDSQGRKRCPHGIRTTKNGRKEYCTKPVDC